MRPREAQGGAAGARWTLAFGIGPSRNGREPRITYGAWRAAVQDRWGNVWQTATHRGAASQGRIPA